MHADHGGEAGVDAEVRHLAAGPVRAGDHHGARPAPALAAPQLRAAQSGQAPRG